MKKSNNTIKLFYNPLLLKSFLTKIEYCNANAKLTKILKLLH